MDLTITKERVLETAERCPESKEALKSLFPEVFTKLTTMGDFWQYKDREIYIVAKVGEGGSHLGLVNINDGNNWSTPIRWNRSQYVSMVDLVGDSKDYGVRHWSQVRVKVEIC